MVLEELARCFPRGNDRASALVICGAPHAAFVGGARRAEPLRQHVDRHVIEHA
jgi:hypothetical protein